MTHPGERRWLTVYWLLTAAGFVLGVALLWGVLAREHRRLPPAQAALLWSGEAAGGVWFLRFGWRHVWRADPLPDPGPGRPADFWLVWLTLLAGWLLDLGVTVYRSAEGRAAHARAVPADGQLLAGHRRLTDAHGGGWLYTLAGEFATPDGRAWAVDHVELGRYLSADVRAAVDAGRLPAPLPLWYDPDRPARTWLVPPGQMWAGRDNLVNIITLFFQFVLLLLLLDNRVTVFPTRAGPVPVEQVGMFAASALAMVMLGGLRMRDGSPRF